MMIVYYITHGANKFIYTAQQKKKRNIRNETMKVITGKEEMKKIVIFSMPKERNGKAFCACHLTCSFILY